LINVPSQFEFYVPVLDFECKTNEKNKTKTEYNPYYIYVALDKLCSGFDQGISFKEDGISYKSTYMYVSCLKYKLFLPGTLRKYELYKYYLKIIDV